MAATCEDCGTRTYSGVCPNCHEELFIYSTQGDDLPARLSDEFAAKVAEQREIVIVGVRPR